MASENQWAYELESTVVALVKAKTLSALKNKYPKIRITDEGESSGSPAFPTVYIHLLPPTERGKTLEGRTVNAVLATFQIDVTTNTGKADCRRVTSAVVDVFKTMRFSGAQLPEYSVADKIYKGTARMSRTIAANDRLL